MVAPEEITPDHLKTVDSNDTDNAISSGKSSMAELSTTTKEIHDAEAASNSSAVTSDVKTPDGTTDQRRKSTRKRTPVIKPPEEDNSEKEQTKTKKGNTNKKGKSKVQSKSKVETGPEMSQVADKSDKRARRDSAPSTRKEKAKGVGEGRERSQSESETEVAAKRRRTSPVMSRELQSITLSMDDVDVDEHSGVDPALVGEQNLLLSDQGQRKKKIKLDEYLKRGPRSSNFERKDGKY